MTTLNTIIEEGKDKIFCKYDFGYMNGTTVGVIEDLNNDLDTAMQRAYEAGRTDWLRSEIERLEKKDFDVVGWLRNTYGLDDDDCLSAGRVQELCELLVPDVHSSIITWYKEELKVLESK